jgi:hypothetical protein
MTSELILLLEKVKEKITDDSDVIPTGYNSAKDLRNRIKDHIRKLKSDDLTSISELKIHFAPTGTFQEHSISNGWSDEYLALAQRFDKIYDALKK